MLERKGSYSTFSETVEGSGRTFDEKVTSKVHSKKKKKNKSKCFVRSDTFTVDKSIDSSPDMGLEVNQVDNAVRKSLARQSTYTIDEIQNNQGYKLTSETSVQGSDEVTIVNDDRKTETDPACGEPSLPKDGEVGVSSSLFCLMDETTSTGLPKPLEESLVSKVSDNSMEVISKEYEKQSSLTDIVGSETITRGGDDNDAQFEMPFQDYSLGRGHDEMLQGSDVEHSVTYDVEKKTMVVNDQCDDTRTSTTTSTTFSQDEFIDAQSRNAHSSDFKQIKSEVESFHSLQDSRKEMTNPQTTDGTQEPYMCVATGRPILGSREHEISHHEQAGVLNYQGDEVTIKPLSDDNFEEQSTNCSNFTHGDSRGSANLDAFKKFIADVNTGQERTGSQLNPVENITLWEGQ